MFSEDQREAVRNLFRAAGFQGHLRTAPVTSEDERVFVLDPEDYDRLSDREGLELTLQQELRRKAWIVRSSQSWTTSVPFS